MSERIDRKDLRTDGFAVAIEHNVEYVSSHRSQFIRYGAIALAGLLVGAGLVFYMNYRHDVRQEKLGDAIAIQEANVTPGVTPGPLAFPTDQAKRDAATKAFTDVTTAYSGSKEGLIAEYYLGAIAADAGRLDEARKRFQQVADSGNNEYGSLAKLSLANMDLIENKGAEGEKILKDLMDHPTVFVSKEQAAVTLARYYGSVNRNAEARKLLEPITATPNGASQAAVQILGELQK